MGRKAPKIIEKNVANISENDDNDKYYYNLMNDLSKVNSESYLLVDSPYSKIENFISTGNYTLNAQISGDIFKGIPEGRITMIAGPSGTGKSFLSLNIASQAQKQGYFIIWIDSENALDLETALLFDINPKRFNLVPIGTINEATTYLINFIDIVKSKYQKDIDKFKILLVIDSLGNLATDKEIKDMKAGEDKIDLTRAKELRRLFRTITKDLGILKIPAVITNHTYSRISFIPGYEISGGEGPIFNASIVLLLTKAKLSDSKNRQRGIIVTSKVKKSRFTKGGIDHHFYINFTTGLNPYIGLERFVSWELCGIDNGKLDENGNFIKSNDKKYYFVKHLNKQIKAKDLFTAEVFTQEVLEKLNTYMQKYFQFQQATEEDYENFEKLILEED